MGSDHGTNADLEQLRALSWKGWGAACLSPFFMYKHQFLQGQCQKFFLKREMGESSRFHTHTVSSTLQAPQLMAASKAEGRDGGWGQRTSSGS